MRFSAALLPQVLHSALRFSGTLHDEMPCRPYRFIAIVHRTGCMSPRDTDCTTRRREVCARIAHVELTESCLVGGGQLALVARYSLASNGINARSGDDANVLTTRLQRTHNVLSTYSSAALRRMLTSLSRRSATLAISHSDIQRDVVDRRASRHGTYSLDVDNSSPGHNTASGEIDGTLNGKSSAEIAPSASA